MTETQDAPAPRPADDEGAQEPDSPPPLDLRVAEVTEAGEHPNADRLLKLRIDLGYETRQLVAGLAGIYDTEELVGKRVVVVANLKAAKLRGEISEGMLLASHGLDSVGLLLAPDAGPGTPVLAGGAPAAAVAEDDGSARITIDDFAAHTIEATPDGVTIDGARVESPRLVVDREAWGTVK